MFTSTYTSSISISTSTSSFMPVSQLSSKFDNISPIPMYGQNNIDRDTRFISGITTVIGDSKDDKETQWSSVMKVIDEDEVSKGVEGSYWLLVDRKCKRKSSKDGDSKEEVLKLKGNEDDKEYAFWLVKERDCELYKVYEVIHDNDKENEEGSVDENDGNGNINVLDECIKEIKRRYEL